MKKTAKKNHMKSLNERIACFQSSIFQSEKMR